MFLIAHYHAGRILGSTRCLFTTPLLTWFLYPPQRTVALLLAGNRIGLNSILISALDIFCLPCRMDRCIHALQLMFLPIVTRTAARPLQ
jgi:hypothetical protein